MLIKIFKRTRLWYVEKGVQATQLGPMDESHDVIERPQRQLTLRHLVLQEAYVPTRLTGFTGSDSIEFVVNGEEGVRLLDALEGNWTGFERWNDRPLLSEGGRLQIIIRLLVSLSINVYHQLC